MPEIRILADEVINQIAAGEVVERPASVVKELVENALDAGARRIRIETDGGGKRFIRVIDDGRGMTAAEIELALRRHATSKLRVLDDLCSLDTLGFRGEALPSIASVSKMTIVSRTAEMDAGAKVVIEGGKIVERGEVGVPPGTQIEVCDLLGNVPARQKFLKGDATESAQISEVVQKIALAHPEIDFSLTSRSRMSLRAPVHKNGLERVSLILGARLGRKLFPIEGEESGIRVTAYLAAPDLAQTTSRCLFLFVGRRAIRDRGMLMAVARGYGELVPRGRYPVAVVRVDVSMTDVDVNVHPQKAEVRFSDAQAVYAAVRHTVARGVASAPWLGEIGGAAGLTFRDTAGQAVSPMSRELAGYQQRSLNFQRTVAPWARIGRPDGDLVYGGIERGGEAGLLGGGGAGLLGGGGAGLLGGGGAGLPPGGEAGLPPGGEAGLPGSGEAGLSAERVVWKGSAATSPEAVPDFFSSLRYIGQLDRTFLLCERAGELILVDQHAAHERVVYERLRARRRHEGPASQPLLFPEVLEVSAAEAAHVETFTDELHAAGFVLEPFGDSGQRSTVALKATPAGLRDEPRGVVLELLADLSDFQATDATASRFDLAMATVACHSSVRAGDVLSPAEVVALFADLDRIEYRANCPHGRPVLLRISLGEIARRFGRSA